MRATLSFDDGETWDWTTDQIVLDGQTPWGSSSGGGSGNTLQLGDGALVTGYSYRGGDDGFHTEVVRRSLPDRV